jgi:alcohol dehydrogenase, propanol-preferring
MARAKEENSRGGGMSMLTGVRALQITTWHREAELVEVDEPQPAAGQVVVKVGAAGACHSDLHMMHGEPAAGPFSLPFTLGHEIAGWVHAIGDGVTTVEVGQQIAVYGAWGCGVCDRCAAGLSNYCDGSSSPVGTGPGLGVDGGMADYVLVPDARDLVPVPEGLSLELAAPLTDAGLTPYHAVRRSLPKLGPMSTAVVVGVGGLGHLAVQVIKATSAARVIAVDTRPQALDLALTVGADEAIAADDAAAPEIRRLTRNKRGAELVLDFVGTKETLALAAACTRSMGDLTVVGVAGGMLPFSFMSPANEVSVQTVYWGSRPELAEVLALGARGLLKPWTTTYPLDQAIDAYRALAAGEVIGRAVIVPATEASP